MKIALVILHADPARGGAERYTVDLAAALVQRGHAVSLISSESLDVRGATRSGRYRSFLDALDQHRSQNHYDIVHAMLPVRRCDIYHPHAGMASVVWKSPRLKRLLNPRRVRFAQIEQELLTSSSRPVVLCLSQYVKRDVLRYYPDLPDGKLPILFNAVDLDRFDPGRSPSPLPPRRPIALMIAQDFFRKGLREAIEALARIPEDLRPWLYVVGKGDTGPYERIVRALRLDEFVRFRGPTNDPYGDYRGAAFFLLPTKHDPCSLVVLEALAMGVPVISTKFNGATEIMTDGVHGYVLDDPTDLNALADAMRRLLDPQRRADMSKACLELRPKLSYEHHLDQLEAIYRRVQSDRSAAQASAARVTE